MEEDPREAATRDAGPAGAAHDGTADAGVVPSVHQTDEDAPGDAETPDAPAVTPTEDASPSTPPSADQGGTTGTVGRALKLVLTLRPLPADGGTGYQAVLAVGADGCDPQLHVAEVDGLPAALAEVPGLAARAEAHWQRQPRYPIRTRQGSPASSAGERPASSPRRTRTPDPLASSPALHPEAPAPMVGAPPDVLVAESGPLKAPEVAPRASVGSAPVKQLTLFG